ncbi:NACHT domain-containing protein [Mastigocoleus sp. MO_188.B34]|uniref:NACHT and WD40 repeat domain-containing protein n=1 Tax=Mastigocoleus sp. MO_188.B34 TaxID=3036635 RepID=UPI00262F742C|nr:NACHT domain-containing protein [Mastigocoleus sp. MO_188.B34]MDJ0694937.1 NACHT domain-containing protein [Mastigocoleus sp. MO_188.B34]
MTSIPLDPIFKAITSIAIPVIKNQAQRSEIVIKLLKKFKIDPEHPPADFRGVYAYTLVEYGVWKPKPVLELFRKEEIKKAFRQAFDRNNASILLSEVDDFIDAYALGDEIKDLRIDIRREIASFYIIFSEIAKRTRNPADTMMSQQIGSLHRSITNIQEQLNRLPTLEGIRTEIAHLALPENNVETRHVASDEFTFNKNVPSENQCRAIALAQQMRGWFKTLGYDFEKYEVWAEEYFELIINIPVRRSFERILVRGIAGEVGLSDVMALRKSVQEQRTDEGWLVTTRRISRAARDEIKKNENRDLDCYTFDELIDLDADFSGYIKWLETEIKRREIDTKYVPLACIKEEIDPVTKQRIGVSRYEEEDGWIDGYIDLWLDDPAKEHISILGEFGTGKTWFAFHYAWTALQRYRDAEKRGLERPRLPVVITLRDFAKALNVENVLAGFFFTQHNIRINSDVFDQLNRMGKLLLIFDGFDEMAAKVDHQQMINNFWELAKVVVPGAKVILTCRTEHFPEAQEGRALLNAELQASTANLSGETPQFEVLELEKFNDEQIKQVLSFQVESSIVEQVMGSPQLLDLARRPVMTDLILEALPDIQAGKQLDISRIYLYAVRRKMERDIKAERTFTSLAEKLYFLCELSWEMLSTDQMSLNYKLFPDRIRRLFDSIVQEQTDLDHWHYDMMGQTMLIRNANGDYTPAHRSLLEFFVAYKFAAELGTLADDFTELARSQSCLDGSAEAVEYTWSGYFSRQLDETGRSIAIKPLKKFTRESLEKLRETFGRSPLTKAVLDLMLGMVGNNQALIKVIEATRGRNEDEVAYVGGNAATLAVKFDKWALEGIDFSGAVIRKADFSNASLQNVNFARGNLADSVFTKIFGIILSVAFSPDGRLFATGDSNGVVTLWDTANNREILTFKGHTNSVSSVAFSQDGETLASSSRDQTVRLWDISARKCLYILQGHNNWITSVAFSPRGDILASGSRDQTIKLWDTTNGKCCHTFQGHTDSVLSVDFSADGTKLASGSNDKTVRLWDLRSRKSFCILQGHTSWVGPVAFSPRGNILASGSADQNVKLWDIISGECLYTLKGHFNSVNSVAFSPQGNILASGSRDKTVKLWDISNGECLCTFQGHTNTVNSVAFNPQSNILASGSRDQTVKLWDIATGECLHTLHGYVNWVRSIAFSTQGNTLLASGSADQIIRLWNIHSGECFRSLYGHTNWIFFTGFIPNGNILVSSDVDQTIRLWNISNGECLQTLKLNTNSVLSVALSPQSHTFASGGDDQMVRLWDIRTGECLRTFEGHISWVRSVAFSPEGDILASGSDDRMVRLWDLNTGECLYTLQGHSNWIGSVKFSPEGNILASGSGDKTVRLWDIENGKCLYTLHGHTNRIYSVAFSPEGNILASGSVDQTVRLWDVKNGECIYTLQGHNDWINSMTFGPDGKILASASDDETIKLWDVKTGKCLKTLINEKPYQHMNITGVKGLSEAEKSTLKALGAVEEVE